MTNPRTAIVVVHGVADQRPGDTARAVVDLLVASPPDGVHYAAGAAEDFTLAVDPLAPIQSLRRRGDATPFGEDRSFVKALVQSGRSDFQRPGLEAPDTLARFVAECKATAATAPPASADRGIEATNYLLAKALDNGARSEAYQSTRIPLQRHGPDDGGAGSVVQIDVHEMYWADLSRLSGALPRVVTELFTLVFRLSKLGRDTVDEAWRQVRASMGKKAPSSWRAVVGLQVALDWLFCNVLALLFSCLLFAALFGMGLGALRAVGDSDWWLGVIGGVTGGVGVLLLAYRRQDRPALWVLPIVLWVCGMAATPLSPVATHAVALLLLALLSAVLDQCLRLADDRFPFTRRMGRLLWSIAVLLMAASLVDRWPGDDFGTALEAWMRASYLASEIALLAIKWWWIGAGPLLLLWLVAGFMAARKGGYEARASISTGRLGLCVSLCTFVMVAMAIWALVSTPLQISAAKVEYAACIFGRAETGHPPPADRYALQSCPWSPVEYVTHADTGTAAAAKPAAASATAAPKPPPSSAQLFMTERYTRTTAFFALIGVVLLMLLAYLGAVLTPSVLAELKLLAERVRASKTSGPKPASDQSRSSVRDRTDRESRAATRRLGRWLTQGYLRLDLALKVVTASAVLAALVVTVMFLWAQHFGGAEPALDRLSSGSQALLNPLVLSAATLTAALSLLGGVLSRYIPALRAPLDVMLDVDNHLREFPRRAIPRARIFARYKALLDRIDACGYDRIVIVAHSQGTVITAELLRFLLQDPSRGIRTPVSFLTLGCPLRQLYAARFPTLYRWVLSARNAGNGPSAADIGAERWLNAFTSGDYVGRWLWSSPEAAGDTIGHPMIDTVHPVTFGRADAYAPFDPMPPAGNELGRAREAEVCLGLGAHTHYFEPNQYRVAWLIDFLVRAP